MMKNLEDADLKILGNIYDIAIDKFGYILKNNLSYPFNEVDLREFTWGFTRNPEYREYLNSITIRYTKPSNKIEIICSYVVYSHTVSVDNIYEDEDGRMCNASLFNLNIENNEKFDFFEIAYGDDGKIPHVNTYVENNISLRRRIFEAIYNGIIAKLDDDAISNY